MTGFGNDWKIAALAKFESSNCLVRQLGAKGNLRLFIVRILKLRKDWLLHTSVMCCNQQIDVVENLQSRQGCE